MNDEHATVPPPRSDEPAVTLPLSRPGADQAMPILAAGVERYEVRERLGRGGMGLVDLCLDRKIRREVARKSIVPEASDGAGRFVREALVQARLEHPVFVPVYDVESGPDGPAFTMRRVRGRSLRAVLEARSTEDSEQRLLRAFVELCLAVDYAHSRGVVHRDIKPENVMLGDFGEVYLLDWGIARVRGDVENAPDEDIAREGTRAGAMLGTPGYMPPEQLRGEHDRVDARSDVYALGATLFELLAGSPMHQGASLGAVMTSTFEPGDHRPSRRRAGVAAELDAVVMRATAFEPSARFADTRSMAREVERYLDGERDANARKLQAAQLAADARAALAGAPSSARRIAAGRRASSALALDPGNVAAREALVEALTHAGDAPPPSAVAQVDARRGDMEVATLREFGRALVFFLPMPIAWMLIAGIRDWTLALSFVALTIIAGLVLATTRRGPHQETWIAVGYAILCLSNAVATRIASPWITIPASMIGNGLVATLYARTGQRRRVIAMSLATVMVPALLDETRLIAPSYEIVGSSLVIHPRMTGMITWIFFVYYAALSVVASRVLWRVLDRARETEAQMHAMALTMREIATPEPAARPSA